MTTIYKKQGRRYVEIGTCAQEREYYPHGAHLVWSRPGSVLTKYNIEPADAALLSAAERVRDAMVDTMHKASLYRPFKSTPMTEKERKAWEAYRAIAGDVSSIQLHGASLSEVIDAGINVLIQAVKASK